MRGKKVWVWVKDGRYARWGVTEPTTLAGATYFDTEREARAHATLVVDGYKLVQVQVDPAER